MATATGDQVETKVQMKETIPLWIAIGITVFVSVPFSLWLGSWNFAVWASFIVWAEYFALGATPAAVKTILPAYSYSAILTALTLAAIPFFSFLPSLVVPGDLSIALVLAVGVAIMVYTMKYAEVFQKGSLPFFNGISMVLAIYFTGSYPQLGAGGAEPIVAGLWAIAMAVFGCLLGIFNVWITFPKEAK